MDAAAQGQPPFMLHPETVGIFPHNPRRVRVLWAGLGGEVVCMDRLYRSLSRELSQQEIKTDRQRFSPHITLARFKKAPPVRFMEKVGNDPWLAASGPEFRVEGIHLYQSELRPEGARYTCLHTSWFKGTN
jgi:2'-5' RNA ligase